MINDRLTAFTIAFLTVTTLVLAFQNCAKDLPSDLVKDTTSVNGLPLKVFVGRAEQSATVTSSGANWKDLTGAVVSFTLNAKMTVVMRAMGSLSSAAGTTYSAVHCGIRFVVDNVPYGDTSWGDLIVGVNTTTATTVGWWTPYSTERHLELEAGLHTIQVQMTGWPGVDSTCSSPNNSFNAAKLFVEAY